MIPPASGEDVKPQELEEAKEGGPLFHCDLLDSEVVHKIAEALLPGFASACVDNTTGDLMRSTASVAVDIRREMVDYLVQRSEKFVAEAVVLDGVPDTDVSDHPFDIISDFIDDFATSKRNFFSKVSGWLLSERREDRIDDFVQEMELNGFWLIGRRQSVAETLLKNVDFKNAYHCNMKFKVPEDLDQHRSHCGFRTIICTHEGCDARFSAAHLDDHESVCPFKIIPCEQKCSENIMRREMDRHCITVCTMKLVNCPFYPVGCQSTIPQCKINEHRLDSYQSHLLNVLQHLHKEMSEDNKKKRMEQIEKISSPDHLASFRDVRSFTYYIKNLEIQLLLSEETKTQSKSNEHTESVDKERASSSSSSEEGLESPSKHVEVVESTIKDQEHMESPSRGKEDLKESPEEKEKSKDLSPKKEVSFVPLNQQENLTEQDKCNEKIPELIVENQKQIEESASSSDESTSPVKGSDLIESPIKMDEQSESPFKRNEQAEERSKSPSTSVESTSPVKGDDLIESPVKIDEHSDTPFKGNVERDEQEESIAEKDDQEDSPVKRDEQAESSSDSD